MTTCPVYYDSHCHLDFPAFDADRTQVLERAAARGVKRFFIPGVSPGQWQRLADLCSAEPRFRFGLGLHPFFLEELSQTERDKALECLPERCGQSNAVAVGEFGLDRLKAQRGGASMKLQLSVCEAQLMIAKRLQLPVVLHAVRAHGPLLEMLERVKLSCGGVLHGYSGGAGLVERYARLGFSFGFGGAVTKDNARRASEALAVVPKERLLLETDAPDQAPAGYPSRNEPESLPTIAARIAQIRGVSLEEVAEQTRLNAERLFGG